MLSREEIQEIVRKYDLEKVIIGTIGSHSALDICDGAVEEGFKTVVWAQKGREKPYARYFKTIRENETVVKGCVDQTRILDKFREILSTEEQDWMLENNVLFIPNRSFVSYLGIDHVEKDFHIPMIGSRNLLGIEERGKREKDYYWILEHPITNQEILRSPCRIHPKELISLDELVIVKLHHAKHSLERGFFTAASWEEFREKASRLLQRGIIESCEHCSGEGCSDCYETGINHIEKARIEKYSLGPVFNFNFFYSPINKLVGEEPLELLGIDARFESNLDAIARLPADQQLRLPEHQKDPTFIVVGHHSISVRESLLSRVFEMAEEFIRVSRELFSPGMIGAFCIQTVIEDDMKPTVYDIATRIGGGTNSHVWLGAPYGNMTWREHMSTGRRIALEIRRASRHDMLEELVT